jgi:hypothetical protein
MCVAVVPWDLKAVRAVYQGVLHVDRMRRRAHAEWHARWKHGHEHISRHLLGTHGENARHKCVFTVAELAIGTTTAVPVICKVNK